MKTKRILLFATIALVAPLIPIATKAATQVYDLNADWSATQNPNGPWSFWESVNLLGNTPFPWVGGYPEEPNLVTKITDPGNFPYYGDVSDFLEVGDLVVLSGGNYTSVRWTAPANGMINISGAFWGNGGIFCGWTLTHNGNPVSDDLVYQASKSSPYDLSSGSAGTDGLLNISVEAGDQIKFDANGGPIGLNFSITLTSDSVDPVAAVEALATTVIEMNLQNGIANSLDSKLDAALNVLVDVNVSNDGAACNSLQAFINSVQAQRNKKITNAQADQLIAAAQAIQAMLHCGN